MIGMNDLPLSLGDWDVGQNSNGDLTNNDLLGRTYILYLRDFFDTGRQVKRRLTNQEVHVRLVRNTAGVTLDPSMVVQMDLTTEPAIDASRNLDTHGSNMVPMLTSVAKLTDGADLPFCGVVDPTLKSAVPDDGIFFLVIKGPVIARLPAAGVELVPGDVLTTAASGRYTKQTSQTNLASGTLGYSLQTRTVAGDADGKGLINLAGFTMC